MHLGFARIRSAPPASVVGAPSGRTGPTGPTRPTGRVGRHALVRGAGWWRSTPGRGAAGSAGLVAAAAAALAAYAMAPPGAGRAVLTLPFLLVCPGLAVVRWVVLPSRLVVLTLAVAVSLVLDQAVAMVTMYAHAWSPGGCLAALAALTCCAAAAPHARALAASGRGQHVLRAG